MNTIIRPALARSEINLEPHYRGWLLTAEQWLPKPLDDVWPFFADAHNLQAITPAYLGFNVLTPAPIEMREGALIDYRLSIRGFPVQWRTEIAVWDPPHRFVDTQLRGPYRRWWHEHTFEQIDGGTICGDRIEYEVPGGPLAPIVNALFVQRDVEGVFRYRAEALQGLFGGVLSESLDSVE